METRAEPIGTEVPAARISLRLRVVLVLVGLAQLAGFHYGNRHTEDFRLTFERFQPWLWNLYLTCALAAFVGVLGLWWCRKWGLWLMAGASILAVVIGVYAMGFSLVGIAVAVSLALVWFAAQPDWKSFE